MTHEARKKSRASVSNLHDSSNCRTLQTFTDVETTHVKITEKKHISLCWSTGEYQLLHAQYSKSRVVQRNLSAIEHGRQTEKKPWWLSLASNGAFTPPRTSASGNLVIYGSHFFQAANGRNAKVRLAELLTDETQCAKQSEGLTVATWPDVGLM